MSSQPQAHPASVAFSDITATGERVGSGLSVAIMQPYFFPYLGYFQLIAAVDRFVVYDDIKYTKKGWINRNRILLNGCPASFSLPLRKCSDQLDIRERELAGDYRPQRLLDQLRGAYRAAPCFAETWPLMERIFGQPERNLFRFLLFSLHELCVHLGIGTELVVSSTLLPRGMERGEERVLAICDAAGASSYFNPIGGLDLYNRATFAARGINLRFLRCREQPGYPQFGPGYVPNLSIIDVLMFNTVASIQERLLDNYDLY